MKQVELKKGATQIYDGCNAQICNSIPETFVANLPKPETGIMVKYGAVLTIELLNVKQTTPNEIGNTATQYSNV